jgi:hypothetical protein
VEVAHHGLEEDGVGDAGVLCHGVEQVLDFASDNQAQSLVHRVPRASFRTAMLVNLMV